MHALFEDMIDHFETLFNEMKKAFQGLTVEALDWVPGPETNSIGLLVVHTCGATRYWTVAMGAQQSIERSREAEFQSKGNDEDALVAMIDSTMHDVREVLGSLALDDLTRSVVSEPHKGREFRIAWSLMHALEHAAQHVAHAQLTRQWWEMQNNK